MDSDAGCKIDMRLGAGWHRVRHTPLKPQLFREGDRISVSSPDHDVLPSAFSPRTSIGAAASKALIALLIAKREATELTQSDLVHKLGVSHS